MVRKCGGLLPVAAEWSFGSPKEMKQMCLCCITCHDSGLREWWFRQQRTRNNPFVTAALGSRCRVQKKHQNDQDIKFDSKHQSEQPFRSTRNYKRPINGSRLLFRNYISHGAETGIHNTKCKTTE